MASNNIFSDYVEFLEELRRDNKQRLEEAARGWNELANKRSSELSKHLFTIASLVLPLSLIPITNGELLMSMNLVSRDILVIAWVFFIISLISGITHLMIESDFFNKWAEQEGKRSDVYSEGIFTTNPVSAFNRFEKMNKESKELMKMSSVSSNKFLYAQEFFLVGGIALIGFILACKVLFL